MGEPPYRDFPWSNSRILGYYELLETPYTPPAPYVERGEASGVGMFGVGGREYSFLENANLLRGLLDTFSLMYPQLQHRAGTASERRTKSWRVAARSGAWNGAPDRC